MAQQNTVVTLYSDGNTFTFTEYYKSILWPYLRGQLDWPQVMSFGRVGVHVLESVHYPGRVKLVGGRENKNGNLVQHPIVDLSEKEDVDLNGAGKVTGNPINKSVTQVIKMKNYHDPIEALYRTIEHWPDGNPNSNNRWTRYYLAVHAKAFGLVGGRTWRHLCEDVKLNDDRKVKFIEEHLFDSDPEGLRKLWYAQEKQEAELKAKAEKAEKAKKAKATA